MAGFKHRYLIVKIRSSPEQSFETTLRRLLVRGLKESFGDYVLGKMDHLEVCEYHAGLGIAIVRCNIDVYKYLCYTIVTLWRADRARVGMSILLASGILKKAKRALLKYIKEEESQASA